MAATRMVRPRWKRAYRVCSLLAMCARHPRNGWLRRLARGGRLYRRFTACWPSARNWRSRQGRWSRRRRGGEPEREFDPAVRRTTRRCRPAVQPHDRLHDGQPQAARFREFAAGRIAAIETVEQARELVGRYGLALVTNHDQRAVRVLAAGKPDRGAGFGVAHRVHHDVADRAPGHDRVGGHLAFGMHFETEIAFVGDAFEVRRNRLQLFANVQRGPFYVLPLVIRLREEQDVLRDAPKPLQLLQIRFQHALVFALATRVRERHLRLSDQYADRRAHLVRQIRGELQQPFITARQAVEHGVERHREALQFGRGVVYFEPS